MLPGMPASETQAAWLLLAALPDQGTLQLGKRLNPACGPAEASVVYIPHSGDQLQCHN